MNFKPPLSQRIILAFVGLGLGLSLVQRICEREKWTITLEENQPSGCCFRINFA